jgi:hypothetical protein
MTVHYELEMNTEKLGVDCFKLLTHILFLELE